MAGYINDLLRKVEALNTQYIAERTMDDSEEDIAAGAKMRSAVRLVYTEILPTKE
jgi:hypothetical protein